MNFLEFSVAHWKNVKTKSKNRYDTCMSRVLNIVLLEFSVVAQSLHILHFKKCLRKKKPEDIT